MTASDAGQSMSAAAPLTAAFRDASFFNRPDVTSLKKAHVLRGDGRPACGLHAVMCDPLLAEDVPDWQRCKRPGCKGAWPADGQPG